MQGTIGDAKQKLQVFCALIRDMIVKHKIPIKIKIQLKNFKKLKTEMIQQFGKKIKKEYVYNDAIEFEHFKIMSTPSIYSNEKWFGVQTALMKQSVV